MGRDGRDLLGPVDRPGRRTLIGDRMNTEAMAMLIAAVGIARDANFTAEAVDQARREMAVFGIGLLDAPRGNLLLQLMWFANLPPAEWPRALERMCAAGFASLDEL